MNNVDVLNNLQKSNEALKSKLLRYQLKSNNYSFEHYKKCCINVINEYRIHKSLYKASQITGTDFSAVMNWYIQGQLGNPLFRGFFLLINEINSDSDSKREKNEVIEGENRISEDNMDGYEISRYGDGWSYKTFIDGEKIFIISNELETLKRKVKDKHLPID